MNFHQSGVDPTVAAKNAKLAAFFNILSTNVDRNGKPFVSTIEGMGERKGGGGERGRERQRL